MVEYGIEVEAAMRRIVLIVVLWMSAGCGSDPAGSDGRTIESLFGSWDWVSANGGIAGGFRTPLTEGFTMRIEFTEPDRLELFRNGELVTSTVFEVLEVQRNGDLVTGGRIRHANLVLGWMEHTVGFDIEGGLILTDPCCDGFTYSWTRIDP